MQATAHRNQVKTIQQSHSLVMMRNLIRTAISSIVYIRGVFDEDNFGDRILAGLRVKSLKPKTEEGKTLCDWLEEGVFDALSKKYLRLLVFGIYGEEDDPSTLTECYNFSISYDGQDIQMNVEKTAKGGNKKNPLGSSSHMSMEDVKVETLSLIRKLIMMTSNMQPLPEDRYITMRLFYYDDITPPDYEPKYFVASPPSERLGFDGPIEQTPLGSVSTPHHSLMMKINNRRDRSSPISNSQIDKGVQKYLMEINEDDEEERQNDPVEPATPSKKISKLPSNKKVDKIQVEKDIEEYILGLDTVFMKDIQGKFRGVRVNVIKKIFAKMEKEGSLSSPPANRRGRTVMKNKPEEPMEESEDQTQDPVRVSPPDNEEKNGKFHSFSTRRRRCSYQIAPKKGDS
eukprot:TRINITY_DN2976_c0_g1_i1.p1 TRINITY_DN2976_c0_g1~~TRINITY_DN2976_c0_g1_i1.p1  ORF type:complete len:400 (-),score=132.39 TRINITY_DN2976_c0_g1_i1:839-2038(-)